MSVTVDEAGDPVHDEVVKLDDSADIEADLRRLARQLLERVMRPRILLLDEPAAGLNQV